MRINLAKELQTPKKSEIDHQDGTVKMARVQSMAISANMIKLAVCCALNNHVVLYDLNENLEKDRFALKSADKSAGGGNRKSFLPKCLSFSPDSERLAIGQSDNVIFIYRIGNSWNVKKSILNKFSLQSSVVELEWLANGIVFFSIDGRVKFIQTQTNKMFTLMNVQGSICVSMYCHQDHVVAGFLNGQIWLNSLTTLRESSARLLSTTSLSSPVTLVLTSTNYVCFNTSDNRRITFQELTAATSAVSDSSRRSSALSQNSSSGTNKQTIQLEQNATKAICSPSGTIVGFVTHDSLVLFELDTRFWRQKLTLKLVGAWLLTSICWSSDGTKLVTGTVNGSVQVFQCQWKSKIIANRFEVNYVGNKQVVIKDLNSQQSSMFVTKYNVQQVKVIRERFVVIWTAQSLLMGSMIDAGQQSEIEWIGLSTAGIRFSFDYDNVVLISAVGELYLVELGQNQILGSVRTDFISPHLISVRITERRNSAKVFAYLLDAKTIAIVDLVTGLQLCQWSHQERIDWIELNEIGTRLLYRDKALNLVLLNVINQEYWQLLSLCGFVQWVPASDVIVAQSNEKLYVWYDYQKPVIYQISGGELNDAYEIERKNGQTKIKFIQPNTDIVLDEVLLEFDTAIDDGDLERAQAFLELLENKSSSSADLNSMWLTLGNQALKSLNLSVSERAFAAIGDLAKVDFLRQCQHDPNMLALLDSDWDRFEFGDFDQVMSTYLNTYNWDRAITLANKFDRTDLAQKIQTKHYEWLLETNQHSVAAQILERDGKLEEAILLYLKSGQMFQVTKLILKYFGGQFLSDTSRSSTKLDKNLVEKVIQELERSESFEEAGDLSQLSIIDDKAQALNFYIKAKAFVKAIQMARSDFPDQVVTLENQYGEYFMNEVSDPANAVNHFIEAGRVERALEAAIQARQFERASEISSILDQVPSHYGKKIAEYYLQRNQIEQALEMYLNCNLIREAVSMLNDRGQYARAFKIAKKLMTLNEAQEMYELIAKSYEQQGKWSDAERIYLACADVDSAISMYKNHKQYDQMIRLVRQYHPSLVNETSLLLAKELESDRMYKQAEQYYVSASEWPQAVEMYRMAGMWEDAYRVSRAQGGAMAAKQVAYHWSQTMSTPAGAVKMLNQFGLLNQVLDYALESHDYEFSLALILSSGNDLKHKLTDVRLKYAAWLKKEGHYHEAESMFIEAKKPKEAIGMYLYLNDFDDAIRVAEEFVQDEEVIKDILTAQARYIFENEPNSNVVRLNKVESLLLRAGRIEVAIRLYKDASIWPDAIRLAEQYAPHLIDSLRQEMMNSESGARYFQSHGDFKAENREDMISSDKQRFMSMMQTMNDNEISNSIMNQKDLYQALKDSEQNDDKEAITRYTIMLASHLLQDHQALEALNLLAKHSSSVFIIADSKKLLSRIAVIIFSELDNFTNPTTESDQKIAIYIAIRDCFYQMIQQNTSLTKMERELFEKYLLVSHYLTLKSVMEGIIKQNKVESSNKAIGSIRELHVKLVTALLRYTDLIRADKAFFEAGLACREAERSEMAFVFLNHFLDLLDAIEEGDMNVDHSDFVGTDIPYEVPLPSKVMFDEETVERIKSWVLQTSMDQQVAQTLPLDPIREGEIYEASLINANHSQCLPCLVTGYPVIKHKMIELEPGKYVANKEDWNKILMVTKVLENRDLREILQFIGRLCGNTNILKFSFQ